MTYRQVYHKALIGDTVPLLATRGDREWADESWRRARDAHLALWGVDNLQRNSTPSAPAETDPDRFASDDLRLLALLENQKPGLTGPDEFSHLWRCVWGDSLKDADVDELAKNALRAGDAKRAIDATCLLALHALSTDNIERAVSVARRASRMAAAEGIVQREYFANLVLARVRRFAGQPAASTRILRALEAVVPAPWRGWVEWELLFAGSATSAEPSSFAEPLSEFLKGAAPLLTPPMFPGFARETRELYLAVCADSPVTLDWVSGRTEDVPPALRGLIVPTLDLSGLETAGAFVVVSQDRPARRVLVHGLRRINKRPDDFAFSLSGRRTYRALSALALAVNSQMKVPELFRAVYGFDFVNPKHQGTFRTLLHRMRAELADRAAIERVGDVCQLLVLEEFVLPDPRCAPDLEEVVLRLLGSRSEKLTIDEIAGTLSVPRRTIQRALKGLVEVGSCQVMSEGRNAFYRMEDTTFFDPTLTRLRGGSPPATGQ